MKPIQAYTLAALTVLLVTACNYMEVTDPYDSHEIQRAEYCKRVALFESTRHLPLEDIKGHSNYLGENCEQTNN